MNNPNVMVCWVYGAAIGNLVTNDLNGTLFGLMVAVVVSLIATAKR